MHNPLFTGGFKISGISPLGGLIIEDDAATTRMPKNFLFLNELTAAQKAQFTQMMESGTSLQLIIIPKLGGANAE